MKRITKNREVVLGVTGSIAAFKACDLASRFVKLEARVTAALTRSACHLVGPATLEAITGRHAITDLFEPISNPEIEHIAVATRANLFLVAPATANILAKAATGIADDWISTTLLATRAPILFAPAMNVNMYTHPATQANIQTLESRGCHFIGPEEGRLACGTEGLGRMADPERIVEAALPLLDPRSDLAGKHVVMTTGRTAEPIDPVRFISNRSSGKMGRAVALEALCRGATVTVVTGPADVSLPHGVEVIEVETAAEMSQAASTAAKDADVFVAVAAVSDYRTESPADSKRKRSGEAVELRLIENPDIVAEVARNKQEGQVIVGFAAETDGLIENAAAKLERKNLDLVVANTVGRPDSGFGTDTLEAAFIHRDGRVEQMDLTAKEDLAELLLDRVAGLLA